MDDDFLVTVVTGTIAAGGEDTHVGITLTAGGMLNQGLLIPEREY